MAVTHRQPDRSSRLLTGGGVRQVDPPSPRGQGWACLGWGAVRAVTAPLGHCPTGLSPAPGPHTRAGLACGLLPWPGVAGCLGQLRRISVWQGVSFPKVETRFVGTHRATSLPSPASWRPTSRLTGTYQGQLFHRWRATRRRLRPTGTPTACTAGGATGILSHSPIPSPRFRGALLGLTRLKACQAGKPRSG